MELTLGGYLYPPQEKPTRPRHTRERNKISWDTRTRQPLMITAVFRELAIGLNDRLGFPYKLLSVIPISPSNILAVQLSTGPRFAHV